MRSGELRWFTIVLCAVGFEAGATPKAPSIAPIASAAQGLPEASSRAPIGADATDDSKGHSGEPASSAACGSGDWRLDGAAARPGRGSTFRPEWQATLEQIDRCLSERPNACVRVRGHFDATGFNPNVEHAFGSRQAAQLARARARSEEIVARLYALGLEDWRLKQVPPPVEPTWRGVSVALVEACRATAVVPPVAPPPPVAPSPPVVSEPATAPSPPINDRPNSIVVSVLSPEWELPLALIGSLGGDVLAVEGDAQWGTRLRIGLEWNNEAWYAHLGGGVFLTEVTERNYGGDLIVGGGHRPLSWPVKRLPKPGSEAVTGSSGIVVARGGTRVRSPGSCRFLATSKTRPSVTPVEATPTPSATLSAARALPMRTRCLTDAASWST